jgi:hypothetical protein
MLMAITQKYIIFKDGSVKVFSPREIHAYMTGGKVVVSAGFVWLDSKGFPVKVGGESTTLGKQSREGDLEILREFLKLK